MKAGTTAAGGRLYYLPDDSSHDSVVPAVCYQLEAGAQVDGFSHVALPPTDSQPVAAETSPISAGSTRSATTMPSVRALLVDAFPQAFRRDWLAPFADAAIGAPPPSELTDSSPTFLRATARPDGTVLVFRGGCITIASHLQHEYPPGTVDEILLYWGSANPSDPTDLGMFDLAHIGNMEAIYGRPDETITNVPGSVAGAHVYSNRGFALGVSFSSDYLRYNVPEDQWVVSSVHLFPPTTVTAYRQALDYAATNIKYFDATQLDQLCSLP